MSDSRPILILASGSPRRRQLLAAMGVRFEVMTADVSELDAETAPQLAPADLARVNAHAKAKAVATARPAGCILGADTVVTAEGRIFGKPKSREQAREFLEILSGQAHEVVTGCAIVAPGLPTEIFHDVSRVIFRALTPEIIERYLGAVDVLDKAGAYALQEHGDWMIERVEGSRTNVIGLPVEILEKVLLRRGLL